MSEMKTSLEIHEEMCKRRMALHNLRGGKSLKELVDIANNPKNFIKEKLLEGKNERI